MTHGRAEIHELLLANDLRPSRALGQNFVADGNTVRRIVRLAGVDPGRPVVEIGAGLGSLTLALAEAGASVTAVEIDRHVLPVLRAQVEPLGVRVVEADALTLDWSELLGTDRPASPPTVPGRWWPTSPTTWPCPGDPGAGGGAPGLLAAGHGPARGGGAAGRHRRRRGLRGGVGQGGLLGHRHGGRAGCSASVFIPRPKVESVLVRLDRRADGRPGSLIGGGPGDAGYDRLFAVVRAGFAHRRKMLRRSLEGCRRPEAFEAAGIAPRPGPRSCRSRSGSGWPPGVQSPTREAQPAHPVNAAHRATRRPGEPATPATPPGPVALPRQDRELRPGGAHRPGQAHLSLRVTGCDPTASTCSSPRWSPSTWPTRW